MNRPNWQINWANMSNVFWNIFPFTASFVKRYKQYFSSIKIVHFSIDNLILSHLTKLEMVITVTTVTTGWIRTFNRTMETETNTVTIWIPNTWLLDSSGIQMVKSHDLADHSNTGQFWPLTGCSSPVFRPPFKYWTQIYQWNTWLVHI